MFMIVPPVFFPIPDSYGQIRERLAELPRDRDIHVIVICRSGQCDYIATRMLLQNGVKAKTVSRGMLSLAHNYLLAEQVEEM
jgi:rhodanese-related sulfurtransferase